MSEMKFNNTSLSTFNTFYDGSQLFDTPEKDVTFYPILGKSGDVSISNDRFKNVEISVNCFIRRNFIENYNNLMNFLYTQKGYQKLEFSQEPDVYRMAQFVNAIQPQTGAFLHSGMFTLVFNCMPQKWLKSGLDEISIRHGTTTIINNPTRMIAKPLIIITSPISGTSGRIRFFPISDEDTTLLTCDANDRWTYIDCEIQDAYEGDINRNPNIVVSNGFPYFKPGDNQVGVSGCDIEIVPRWWRI